MENEWIVWTALAVLAAWSVSLAWVHAWTKRFACSMAREVLMSTRETEHYVLCARVEGRIRGCPSEWVEEELRDEVRAMMASYAKAKLEAGDA